MDAKKLAHFLTIQFRYTTNLFKLSLDGLTEEDGLRQPQPAGNCANWVAGHLTNSRLGTLKLLGQKPPVDPAPYARYQRSSDPLTAADGALTLERIRHDFAATGDALAAGLAALTDEAIAAPAPYSPTGNADETIGTLLIMLVFHESYHVGQLGLLRRLAGAEGVIR